MLITRRFLRLKLRKQTAFLWLHGEIVHPPATEVSEIRGGLGSIRVVFGG